MIFSGSVEKLGGCEEGINAGDMLMSGRKLETNTRLARFTERFDDWSFETLDHLEESLEHHRITTSI